MIIQLTLNMTEKRNSYIAREKLKIIHYAKEHGIHAAERMFGPPPDRRTIRRWIQQEDALQKIPKTKKVCRGLDPKWPQVESYVKNWVVEQRERSLSRKEIIWSQKERKCRRRKLPLSLREERYWR